MTRVCPDCGEALEADEKFCGNCGCYLDWTEAGAAQAMAEPEPEPAQVATDPARRGIAERVRSALGVGDEPPPPPPPGPTLAGRPLPATPPVLDVRGTAERPGAAAQQPTAQEPAAQQPSAQQPARPRNRPRPATTLPPPEPLNPGDLICGNCGAGNKPSRKFCRRCGDDLAAAEVAKVPWWKRLFRRKPKAVEAGTRPSRKRTAPRVPMGLVVLLGVLAALVVAGFLLRGFVVEGVDAVRDRVEGVEARIPDHTTASSSLRGHGAGLATNGDPAEYWAPEKKGEGVGEYVEVTFDDPVRLVYVLVTPGASRQDQKTFQALGRPSELKVTVDSDDGTVDVTDLELEDKRGSQEFHIGQSDVTKVRLEIVDSYAGAPGSHTAIGEIEFRVRK
jgi:hypothetical protein